MTSAVIRVKRRITDEPFDKFVLNCKRFKSSPGSENDESGANTAATNQANNQNTILKLAATVSTEDDIKTHLNRLRKCDAEKIVHKVRKPDHVISKLREQFKNEAQNHRFKVVNCFRSIGNDSNGTAASTEGDTEREDITIVDVIKEDANQQQSRPDEQMNKDSGVASNLNQNNMSKFVYDLYLVQSGEQPIETNIDHYTIRPFDDLIYQANDETLNDTDFDTEDSNDEAHWRNEYPDTDDGLSVGEEDMRKAVEDLNFGSDADNLSSDDEDDGNYGENSVVHFIDEIDENECEYNYFKKHGRVPNHAAYYRSNRSNQRKKSNSDENSDIDDDRSSSNSSASSTSSVSPLASCDEDSEFDEN